LPAPLPVLLPAPLPSRAPSPAPLPSPAPSLLPAPLRAPLTVSLTAPRTAPLPLPGLPAPLPLVFKCPHDDGCGVIRGWLTGIFSRITTLFGTAVEAARSSEGIFTSILLLSLFYVEECPVDAQFLRKCVDSIMKLDQKSKVTYSISGAPFGLVLRSLLKGLFAFRSGQSCARLKLAASIRLSPSFLIADAVDFELSLSPSGVWTVCCNLSYSFTRASLSTILLSALDVLGSTTPFEFFVHLVIVGCFLQHHEAVSESHRIRTSSSPRHSQNLKRRRADFGQSVRAAAVNMVGPLTCVY
jgi:hypothetical protein